MKKRGRDGAGRGHRCWERQVIDKVEFVVDHHAVHEPMADE